MHGTEQSNAEPIRPKKGDKGLLGGGRKGKEGGKRGKKGKKEEKKRKNWNFSWFWPFFGIFLQFSAFFTSFGDKKSILSCFWCILLKYRLGKKRKNGNILQFLAIFYVNFSISPLFQWWKIHFPCFWCILCKIKLQKEEKIEKEWQIFIIFVHFIKIQTCFLDYLTKYVSIGLPQRVRHAGRGLLLLRTPCPIPFGTNPFPQLVNVFPDYALRTSLGTFSILLHLFWYIFTQNRPWKSSDDIQKTENHLLICWLQYINNVWGIYYMIVKCWLYRGFTFL